MLSNLTAGMSPVVTIGDAISQVVLSGLFRFISLFYLNDFWRIIRRHAAAAAVADSPAADSDKTKKEANDDTTSNTDSKENSKSD